MRRLELLLLSHLLAALAGANDGVYRSSGGVLRPIHETFIRLDHEQLSFTCRDRMARVDVRFAFNNPEPVPRTLQVGFQAPTAYDPTTAGAITNRIRDFRVMHGGALLPYRLMAAECEDCPLQDTAALRFSLEQGGVYVYLFEITFQPGLNAVQHSYSFEASSGVMNEQDYSYILTTGAKWAGGRIGMLEVDIDLGTNVHFRVNDVFGDQAEWAVVGTGAVAPKASDADARFVRLLSGKLRITTRELRPTSNIGFGLESSHCFSGHGFGGYRAETWCMALCFRTLDPDQIGQDPPLTKADLRRLRNAVYAQYGLLFKDAELDAFFRKFDWYLPDPNLRMADVPLTAADKRFIDEVLQRERQ